MSGQVCSRMGASKVAAFIRESLLIGAHVSRIDIKTDDYQRLMPEDLEVLAAGDLTDHGGLDVPTLGDRHELVELGRLDFPWCRCRHTG